MLNINPHNSSSFCSHLILFSYTNTTSDYKYYQQIPYNLNMIKINIYDSRYILL